MFDKSYTRLHYKFETMFQDKLSTCALCFVIDYAQIINTYTVTQNSFECVFLLNYISKYRTRTWIIKAQWDKCLKCLVYHYNYKTVEPFITYAMFTNKTKDLLKYYLRLSIIIIIHGEWMVPTNIDVFILFKSNKTRVCYYNQQETLC